MDGRFPISGLIAALLLFVPHGSAAQRPTLVRQWDRFEQTFKSDAVYENPVQDVRVTVRFVSPLGDENRTEGFWDGNNSWKVRFSPNVLGKWNYRTECSDTGNAGLHGQSGVITCTVPSLGNNPLARRGPIRVSADRRYLVHEDNTPFFWLADTAWNGALLSSPAEWQDYIRMRQRQGFSAVQFVTTQWRASPQGNRKGQLAYTGREIIQINPLFFQELDKKLDALNDAGLLAAPVLLWAHPGSSVPKNSPGYDLPEHQAIVLARYMIARWQANDVAWLLGGDGNYRGTNAAKWIRIGRAVFGNRPHAPVIMHPGGMHWIFEEFRNEKWLDIFGYQSGHGDDANTVRWLVAGPPSSDWKKEPYRPFINLEPPYEYHISYQARARITPDQVRRAVYWSLLTAPTAGVTYGGHGVWGWDDGTKPPTDHPSTGIPLPLDKAMVMPGAEQMAHVAKLFKRLDWWHLQPAPELLAAQPGKETPKRFIAVSKTFDGQIVAYTPEDRLIVLAKDRLPKSFDALWYNPRTGQESRASGQAKERMMEFSAPSEGDWVLVLFEAKAKATQPSAGRRTGSN